MPFYTIAINFILALPIIVNNLNLIILVIYKFSKRIILIINKNTFLVV